MRDSLTVGTNFIALLASEGYLKLLVMTGALTPTFLICLSTIPRDINIVEHPKLTGGASFSKQLRHYKSCDFIA